MISRQVPSVARSRGVLQPNLEQNYMQRGARRSKNWEDARKQRNSKKRKKQLAERFGDEFIKLVCLSLI